MQQDGYQLVTKKHNKLFQSVYATKHSNIFENVSVTRLSVCRIILHSDAKIQRRGVKNKCFFLFLFLTIFNFAEEKRENEKDFSHNYTSNNHATDGVWRRAFESRQL